MPPQQFFATAKYVYSVSEERGIIALVVAGSTSLLAIVTLTGVMLVKSFRAWRNGGEILPQTHAAPYFISLLVANTFQAFGAVLNIRWIQEGGTQFEPICVAQGVVKNIGDVGIALWSLIIALHAFDVLFLRRTQMRVTLWATVIGIWSFIVVIVLIGPAFVETEEDGPFFGVSGFWCWITPNYPRSRIFLEYIFMFLSAALCGVLHTIVYLRLRGNLSGEDWRSIHFRRIPRDERWVLKLARDEVDGEMYKVANRLKWYPVVYTFVILPITIARFVDFAGTPVPFAVTVATDFIFNLYGLMIVLLYGALYHRIQVSQLPTFATPRKSLYLTNFGITPFVLSPTKLPKTIPESPSEAESSKPGAE